MLEHHLNLNDANFIRDPYPTLEKLRETMGVYFDPVWKKVFFTRYEDIAALLKDRRLGRSMTHILSRDELGWPPANPRQKPFDDFQALHMLDREPPDHTRLRSLVQRAFTQSRVENLRSRIEGIVNRMLDQIGTASSFDVHSDLAEPLPVLVIAELLGVPEEHRAKLRPWSAAIVKLYELGYSESEMEAASNAVLEFSQMLRELVEARRLEPKDDLISALVAVEEQGQKLTEDELIANCILFLNAGHEATVNGTTSAVQALYRNPQALERLANEAGNQPNNSSLFKTAIEEFLRYDTPLPMFERWVLEDIEFQSSVGPIKLLRGSEVALLYASGNRDPRKFSKPNELILDRSDNAHLTFGLGTHYCIGAPLARLEMQVALHALLKRFPRLSLESEPEYGAGFVIRGLRSLRVVRE
jgi:cytochrome P450